VKLAQVSLAVVAFAWPAVARACPACGRGDGASLGTLAALGVMMLVPFGVGLTLWRTLRRADAAREWPKEAR
jgi:hypothetical protein